MIEVRRSKERGHADRGWLKSYHTFSFADYQDPRHTSFRSLRVINEDWFAAGSGFPTHPHREMEILTWVLEGQLEHRDSLGSGSVIRPGEVQVMSAGVGIAHSEFNPSQVEPVHLLQIWITPRETGLPATYDQRNFPEDGRKDRLQLLASNTGRDGSLPIRQDADVYACALSEGSSLSHPLGAGRHGWVQVTGGALNLNGELLQTGDGASVTREEVLDLTARQHAEFLLFDLA